MEKRPYYLFGDLITTTGTGVLTAVLCASAVGEGWNAFLAMVLGMLLGMVLGFVTNTLLGILFGAFEIMIPVMLTGMAAGMIVAMQATGGISITEAARVGAVLGFGVFVFTHLMNACLTGEVRRWTS